VIYAVTDQNFSDPESRVNTFMHVTDSPAKTRNGVLLCVNGTGILYSWLRKLLSPIKGTINYSELNTLAEKATVGADGLRVYPFGNGAERLLNNASPGASMRGLDFNRHSKSELLRASLEGIIFALKMGMDVISQAVGHPKTIKVGSANMFLSPLFAQVFSDVMGSRVEIYDTDGADGAARGAALGSGFYASAEEAFASLKLKTSIEPSAERVSQYREIYKEWAAQIGQL
jgi:xylulokinase